MAIYGRKISAGGGGSAPAVETVTVTPSADLQVSISILKYLEDWRAYPVVKQLNSASSAVTIPKKSLIAIYMYGPQASFSPADGASLVTTDTEESLYIYEITDNVTISNSSGGGIN
ncbi:MAG: hypothetical protein ACOX60_06380 [Massiliimalia sp.]|jgi:hypothetical protein